MSTSLKTLVPGTQDQGNHMTGVHKVQTLVSGTTGPGESHDRCPQMTAVHIATDLSTWDTGPGNQMTGVHMSR